MALQAKPIWRLTADQATARFHAHLPGITAILETDASQAHLGWGAILRLHRKTAPRPAVNESWAIACFGWLTDLIQPSCQ
eukprot:2830977-Rhodomonas_salina.1